ncbi:MAG: ParB N-terminal domain-containing protein [Eubacteriales bacterium]|nr:ParB N-terminal domain-containing protein [Eubacteriales bacterium]
MCAKKLDTGRLDNLIQIASNDSELIDRTILSDATVPVVAAKRALRKQVDPHTLIDNPRNRFNMRRDEEYIALESSIIQRGIDDDIRVKETADGQYMIVSGHRRKKIAIEQGIPKVWIKIDEFKSELDEVLCIIQANITNRAKSPLDMALSIHDLEELINDNSGRKRDTIAEKLGISSKSVHNYSTLLDLPDTIKGWLMDAILTPSQAYKVASFEPRHQQNLIEAVSPLLKDDMNDTEKKNIVKSEIARITKGINIGLGKTREKKAPNANKTLNKAVALLIPLHEQLEIPKSRKKKEEAMRQIESAIETLESIKEKIEAASVK